MSVSTSAYMGPASGTIASESKEPARWSRQVAVDIVGALDISAIVFGAIVPAWIYGMTGGLQIKWMVTLQAALVTAMIHYICMQAWRMYDVSRLDALPVYPGRLFAALMLATCAALGIGIPFNMAEVHLWIWYMAWISASYTAILGVRVIARGVLARMTAAGRFDTRIAVFGAGEIARRVQDHLKSQQSGIHFVGVYDDRPRDRLDADGLDIKGRLDDLIRAGRNGAIDQIIIALPQAADKRMSLIAAKLEQLPVSIHMVTHISSDLVDVGGAHKVSSIGSVGLLDVKGKPLTDWSPMIKRVEDVVLGGVLLAATLPVMALIAVAIKLESKGPVMFRQRRVGLNMETIAVMKFRTMRMIEDDQALEQAQVNDPRVTTVGRFLRRFSLDELPQLFNVLRGDMSLVGPRPHALSHDQKWTQMLATYNVRHQVKPGITGLAQVEGWRGEVTSETDLEQRVKRDVAYIRSWSIGLDLKIVGRTICAVLCPKNAH